MFGTGEWSYDKVSWLSDPTTTSPPGTTSYKLIKGRMPDARIAGPNTSVLYDQVKGFLDAHPGRRHRPGRHHLARAEPPGAVREHVATYRGWEKELFEGTEHGGHAAPDQHQRVRLQLPHLGARPDDPVGLRDRGVQGGRRHRVLEHRRQPLRLRRAVQPRQRPVVAAQRLRLDERAHGEGHPAVPGRELHAAGRRHARRPRSGRPGCSSAAPTARATSSSRNVPEKVFGDRVHAWVREIEWSGQIGDTPGPKLLAEQNLTVGDDGTVVRSTSATARCRS